MLPFFRALRKMAHSVTRLFAVWATYCIALAAYLSTKPGRYRQFRWQIAFWALFEQVWAISSKLSASIVQTIWSH